MASRKCFAVLLFEEEYPSIPIVVSVFASKAAATAHAKDLRVKLKRCIKAVEKVYQGIMDWHENNPRPTRRHLDAHFKAARKEERRLYRLHGATALLKEIGVAKNLSAFT